MVEALAECQDSKSLVFLFISPVLPYPGLHVLNPIPNWKAMLTVPWEIGLLRWKMGRLDLDLKLKTPAHAIPLRPSKGPTSKYHELFCNLHINYKLWCDGLLSYRQ